MKKLQLLLIAALTFTNALAQKLPRIQQASLRAPANIKIDGKATEWEGKFQAYNPGSRVFYTLSNDGENLYLIACMEEKSGNFKAIGAGITLTIQPPKGASGDKKSSVITYPTKGKINERDKINDHMHLVYNLKDDKRKRDSVQNITNKMMATAFKLMDVSGLNDISETSIPVYNLQGIRVAAKISDEAQYVYELAIPLKYISFLADNNGTVNYSIKVNAPAEGAGVMVKDPSRLNPDMLYQLYSTDFSGEYTLAK
nr:hypothetical protein [uncultured Mucilaginibacter sp.]